MSRAVNSCVWRYVAGHNPTHIFPLLSLARRSRLLAVFWQVLEIYPPQFCSSNTNQGDQEPFARIVDPDYAELGQELGLWLSHSCYFRPQVLPRPSKLRLMRPTFYELFRNLGRSRRLLTPEFNISHFRAVEIQALEVCPFDGSAAIVFGKTSHEWCDGRDSAP